MLPFSLRWFSDPTKLVNENKTNLPFLFFQNPQQLTNSLQFIQPICASVLISFAYHSWIIHCMSCSIRFPLILFPNDYYFLFPWDKTLLFFWYIFLRRYFLLRLYLPPPPPSVIILWCTSLLNVFSKKNRRRKKFSRTLDRTLVMVELLTYQTKSLESLMYREWSI